MYLVTADQMRKMDEAAITDLGIPGAVLMENAGRGFVRFFLNEFCDLPGKHVGILAGTGNNGGDGFVIARYLAGQNISVQVYVIGDLQKVRGDALLNLNLLSKLHIPVITVSSMDDLTHQKDAFSDIDIWVDALFGTGLNAEIKGFRKELIHIVDGLKRPVWAVDIPSGLHPDLGQPQGACFTACATITFGFPKRSHLLLPGASFCGRIYIVDIGIPPEIVQKNPPQIQMLTPEFVHSLYQKRPWDAHKGTMGHLLAIGGSSGKSGAVVLMTKAALRVGAGLVTAAVPKKIEPILESLSLESMTLGLFETEEGQIGQSAIDQVMAVVAGKKSVSIGPGLGQGETVVDFVCHFLKEIDIPVVIDADALNAVSKNISVLAQMRAPAVLTPHPGEMARLTGLSIQEIQKDRIGVARDFSQSHQVILALKGAQTLIALPGGLVFVNPTGNPAMASGGMGDVLTGLIAGLMAQGYSPRTASLAAVYLHGLSGDMLMKEKGPVGIMASDLIEQIPGLMDLAKEKKLPKLTTFKRGF